MVRKLWMGSMSLVALIAADGVKNDLLACGAVNSICTTGQQCCSQFCDLPYPGAPSGYCT